MNRVSSELSTVIARLYETFQPYINRSHPEGCPCCVSADDKRKLVSKSLRELTRDDLDRFVWKVLTTWGDVDDLKRFLPRILELMAQDDCGGFDREVFSGKLRMVEWTNWPERERNVVADYFTIIWRDCIFAPDGSVWMDELLCALGRALDDLTPFLRAWERCRAANGYDALCGFIEWNLDGLIKKGRLRNNFWPEAEAQMNQVVDWLSSPATEKRLQMIFEEDANAEFAEPLARAVDQLASLQQSIAANK